MNITLPDLSNYSTFVFLYAAMICLFLFIMLNKFNFKKDKDGIALSVDDDEKNGEKNEKGN